MVKNILKDRIKKAIESNTSFRNMLMYNYKSINVEDIIIKDLEDFLLSKEEIYQFSNFKDLFYADVMGFDSHRFANFLRNIINDHPDKNRTYQHILNDIESKLMEAYSIPNEYIKMKRGQLDEICEELFLQEKYAELKNLRNFIKENFRVHDYSSFVNENRDLARKILKKVDADETDKVYIRLRKLLESNPSYLGLFTYFNKVENIPFVTLERLYNRIVRNAEIIRLLPEIIVDYMKHKLPYQTPDGRTYNKHFERLNDDMDRLEELHKAKVFADEYPAPLRKGLLQNSDFVECIKEILGDMTGEKKKMYDKFFLKKVARYKTPQELLDGLTTFVYAMNDDENFRDTVKDHGWLNMVYDDGDLLVIRARNQNGLQEIASDTSWCIKDSLSYWCDYVKDDSVQLVIIDLKESKTSLYRKIGVTLDPAGWSGNYEYRTAHLKNDAYISEDDLNKRLKKYEITLKDLFDIAVNYGDNEYVSDDEQINDEYRG